MKSFVIIISFAALFSFGNPANILGVFQIPSKSHDVLGSALFKQLAKVGHNVTYISAFPHKNFDNFHHIRIKDAVQYKEENVQKYMQGNTSRLQIFEQLTHMQKIPQLLYETEGVKDLINSNMEFELYINFIGSDTSLALAHRFNTPVVIFAPIGGFPYLNHLAGNPAPYSYVPNMMVQYTDEMNLFERTVNTVISCTMSLLFDLLCLSIANGITNEYFPGYPSMEEIAERADLILVNSHISTESPRPYVPNMIQIGGFHLQEPDPLSENLENVLNDAKEGFIYFSLGTNVKVKELPGDMLDVFKNVLGKLSLKVILKYDEDTMVGKPDNFHVAKWFPQPSVLAHPNAKLFISHGGYGGCTESLYYGVPMICIPFFGDQYKNCADAEYNGYSITVSFDNLNNKTLSEALEKVLYDQKFKEAVKLKSELYRDQPMNPMDKAIYWIEHVIKHKGAKHLKVKGAKLPWYQYYLLDVFLLISAVLLITFLVIFCSCRFVYKKFCARKNKIKMN